MWNTYSVWECLCTALWLTEWEKRPVFVSTFHELCFFYDKRSRHFVTGTQVSSNLRKLEWSYIKLKKSKNENSNLSVEKSPEHVSVVKGCQRSQLANRYCGGLKAIYSVFKVTAWHICSYVLYTSLFRQELTLCLRGTTLVS